MCIKEAQACVSEGSTNCQKMLTVQEVTKEYPRKCPIESVFEKDIPYDRSF